MKPCRPLAAALLLAGLLPSAAADAGDARIREIDYDARTVVRLDGCFGYQTMVRFGAGERIENVGVGDASRWLVVPNKRADILFVKPSFAESRSNMTVATDRRSYNFELVAAPTEACRRGQVVYTLQFRYPHEVVADVAAAPAALPQAAPAPEPPVAAPAARNSSYTFSGAGGNVPRRVFDDGASTWFQWAPGSATPAVYAVGEDKSESPVDFTARGDYLVVDRVVPAFILRSGNAVTVLYNDAYQAAALDPASPQPRVEPSRKKPDRQSRRSLAAWFRDLGAKP